MIDLATLLNMYKAYSNNILTTTCIALTTLYPFLYITRKGINIAINKVVELLGEKYKKLFIKHSLCCKIQYLLVALYLIFWWDILDKSEFNANIVARIIGLIISSYTVITITALLMTMVSIGVAIYKIESLPEHASINLHAQILKIIIAIGCGLTIISSVLGVAISSVLTSLGAATALLTFIFKDTFLGLVSSLQLILQDIARVGDWVTLPSYNADGVIEKITVSIVVIRNFDQTYTTVPTSVFLTTGVKNWRGMFENGARRIKKSINIDMHTISTCDQDRLNTIKCLPSMQALALQNKELFNTRKVIINITLFRHYIAQYLQSHSDIHQQDYTFLVRYLEPNPIGLPIELYVFSKDTNWIHYETIQSNILEHLLGVLPIFGLKVFQGVCNSDSKYGIEGW